MDPKLDPSGLDMPPIDPEMFRRVWNRVMPDQKDSPIVVVPPADSARRSPAPSRPSPSGPTAPPSAPPQPSDAQLLQTMLGQMRAAVVQAQALLRRTNGSSRGLARLAADRQRAFRQLSAAHFLSTGRRFQPGGTVPSLPSDLSLALRAQFLWEQRWARDCTDAAGQTQDASLRELFLAQARDARIRARDIRAMLERM